VSSWEDNEKVDLVEIECVDQRWMELGQNCVQWHA